MSQDSRTKCQSCRYWEPRPTYGNKRKHGICRYGPPTQGFSGGDGATAHWPETWEDDWCGRGKGRLDSEPMNENRALKREVEQLRCELKEIVAIVREVSEMTTYKASHISSEEPYIDRHAKEICEEFMLKEKEEGNAKKQLDSEVPSS